MNNAKKVTLLYKDDDDNCENELIKFEEDEKRFAQIYHDLNQQTYITFKAGSDMSNKFIELLSINYYDIEMNREFRGLVKLLKKIFKQIKRPRNFLDLIGNPRLFFSLLAFTFSGLKSTAFSIDELKNEFHSIVFVQQKAILDLSQNEKFFQQVTWKQKRLIRKYLQGFIKLFITISRDSYNLEKEDCILLFNNFLGLFLTILKTEFNEFLLSFDNEFFYGADKFLRHFNCSESIQKLHIKLITFFQEMMQKIYASKTRNL